MNYKVRLISLGFIALGVLFTVLSFFEIQDHHMLVNDNYYDQVVGQVDAMRVTSSRAQTSVQYSFVVSGVVYSPSDRTRRKNLRITIRKPYADGLSVGSPILIRYEVANPRNNRPQTHYTTPVAMGVYDIYAGFVLGLLMIVLGFVHFFRPTLFDSLNKYGGFIFFILIS